MTDTAQCTGAMSNELMNLCDSLLRGNISLSSTQP